MKKIFLLLIGAIMASGLFAQTLDPSVTWAKVEKVEAGSGLIVSSGNDGRNLIQFWGRSAMLVIGDALYFKASPVLPDTISSIDTTYISDTVAAGSTPSGTYNLDTIKTVDGLSDSLIIGQSINTIDTTWDDVYEDQIWVTKGTAATTQKVPGTDGLSEPKHMISAGGNLFFTAASAANAGTRYIYKYDGSNTTRVSQYPNPYALSEFDGEILFGVENTDNGDFYTCITDANKPAGSRILSFEIAPCPNQALGNAQQWSQYAPFQVITKRDDSGKRAIFFGKDKMKGIEICVADRDTAVVILDIEDTPDPSNSGGTMSTDRGDICIAVNKYQAAFRVVTPGKWGRDSVHVTLQQNMWITDGDPSGTYLFEDQNRSEAIVNSQPATGNSFAGDPFLFKGKLYYTGTTNHDRQSIVMLNTYPNHVTTGTSREELILNGPDDVGVYGNARSGYFGAYGDKAAFSIRVDRLTTDSATAGIFNTRLEHALVIGTSLADIYVADSAKDHYVSGNGNNAMIQHITQYKDKLYYNRFNSSAERNLRVYIDPTIATGQGYTNDTSFFLGSFNSNQGAGSEGGPHNFRVMNGSLYFIFNEALYKFTDTVSNATTEFYDYRDSKHWLTEGIRDWGTDSTQCLFDFGYSGEDMGRDTCPCLWKTEVKEIIALPVSGAVYPNPANNELNINLGNYKATSVYIYNMLGELVLNADFNNNNTIDISNLSSGQYIIGFVTEDKKLVHTKFIKQ